ncbi:MAG: hypothetical protein ACXAEX_02290 [Promethearchaeota archaeon]|jgi:hypothetical protein
MLRTFIFDDSKSHWSEEEHHLLSHDICVILDEEDEVLYLWRGSKSKREKYKKGYNLLKDLTSNFPELNLQVIMAKKNFPQEVQMKLKAMLAKEERGETLIFTRFLTIRSYFIFLIGTIILPFISLLNLSTSLTWNIINGNFEVNNNIFHIWIKSSKILMLITLIFSIINLTIGIIEGENRVIVFSVMGIIICFGLVLYLNFDIYLFTFQAGSTLTNYLILTSDIIIFILINTISILIFVVPNLFKFISFLKSYRKFIF